MPMFLQVGPSAIKAGQAAVALKATKAFWWQRRPCWATKASPLTTGAEACYFDFGGLLSTLFFFFLAKISSSWGILRRAWSSNAKRWRDQVRKCDKSLESSLRRWRSDIAGIPFRWTSWAKRSPRHRHGLTHSVNTAAWTVTNSHPLGNSAQYCWTRPCCSTHSTTPLQLQPPPSMIFLRCCVAMYTSAPNPGACMLKPKPRRQAAQQSSRFKPLTGHWSVAGTGSGGIWAIHAGHSSPGSQSQSYASTPASDTLMGQGWKGWRFWRQGLPPLRRQTMKWRQSDKITTNRHAKMIRLRYRDSFPMLKTWDWQRYQSVRTVSERLMLSSLVFSMKDRACWSSHCHVVSFRLGYSAVASKGHRLMKVWRMTRQSAACAWPQPLWFLHAIFSEPSGAVCWGPISLVPATFQCLRSSSRTQNKARKELLLRSCLLRYQNATAKASLLAPLRSLQEPSKFYGQHSKLQAKKFSGFRRLSVPRWY